MLNLITNPLYQLKNVVDTYSGLTSRLQKEISKQDLRYLSIEKNVAIITACQANRLALSATVITEEHIGESYGKVEVADIVISLSRKQEDEEKELPGTTVHSKGRESSSVC